MRQNEINKLENQVDMFKTNADELQELLEICRVDYKNAVSKANDLEAKLERKQIKSNEFSPVNNTKHLNNPETNQFCETRVNQY